MEGKVLTYGDGDDVEGLGASVVSAVHNGSHRESKGDVELSTSFATTSSLRHFL